MRLTRQAIEVSISLCYVEGVQQLVRFENELAEQGGKGQYEVASQHSHAEKSLCARAPIIFVLDVAARKDALYFKVFMDVHDVKKLKDKSTKRRW